MKSLSHIATNQAGDVCVSVPHPASPSCFLCSASASPQVRTTAALCSPTSQMTPNALATHLGCRHHPGGNPSASLTLAGSFWRGIPCGSLDSPGGEGASIVHTN